MNYSKRQYEILMKSIELIAEKGIQNLTIKNLSQKIGISEPAIYRHFKNKLEILKAVLELFKRESIESFDIQEKEEYSIKKLEEIFMEHINKFNENPYIAFVIFSEEFFMNNSDLQTLITEIMSYSINRIKKIIKDGQERGEIRGDIEPENLTLIFFGGLRLLVKEWSQNGFNEDLLKKGESYIKTFIKILKENKRESKEFN